MTAGGATALITEARAWASKAVLVGRNVLRDLDRGVGYARRLADALEATVKESQARELHHFETEQAIVEAIAACDKVLAVKVAGSSEADAAAAAIAAAIRGILAPALSDEHATTLKRRQAVAWRRGWQAGSTDVLAITENPAHAPTRNPYVENEGAGAHEDSGV